MVKGRERQRRWKWAKDLKRKGRRGKEDGIEMVTKEIRTLYHCCRFHFCFCCFLLFLLLLQLPAFYTYTCGCGNVLAHLYFARCTCQGVSIGSCCRLFHLLGSPVLSNLSSYTFISSHFPCPVTSSFSCRFSSLFLYYVSSPFLCLLLSSPSPVHSPGTEVSNPVFEKRLFSTFAEK